MSYPYVRLFKHIMYNNTLKKNIPGNSLDLTIIRFVNFYTSLLIFPHIYATIRIFTHIHVSVNTHLYASLRICQTQNSTKEIIPHLLSCLEPNTAKCVFNQFLLFMYRAATDSPRLPARTIFFSKGNTMFFSKGNNILQQR